MSAAAARLDGLVALGIQPRRAVRDARKRARRIGVSGETLLLEEGSIGLGDVLATARRDWLARLTPAEAAAVETDLRKLLRTALGPEDAERLRRALARGARISATAATTAATLVAIELAITLAWQEPVSYLSSERAQAGLERELEGKLATGGPAAAPVIALAGVQDAEARERRQKARAELERKSRAYLASLETGDAVGRLRIPALDAAFTVVEGTGASELANGPGHIGTSSLPSLGRTTAISGHRTTYGAPFGEIDELQKGDEIELELPYGTFTYEVERGLVVKPDDFWVTRDIGRERLVLTTCHPEFSAEERLVVFARPKP